MRALIFDIDHTLFDADKALHAGVRDSLVILRRLGITLGAISSDDHRSLVRLDEAGIRSFFADVRCASHADNPKSVAAIHDMLKKFGVSTDETALVSHAHADILLGKDAQTAKTIGVSHGAANTAALREADADYIVEDIPAVLDVIYAGI